MAAIHDESVVTGSDIETGLETETEPESGTVHVDSAITAGDGNGRDRTPLECEANSSVRSRIPSEPGTACSRPPTPSTRAKPTRPDAGDGADDSTDETEPAVDEIDVEVAAETESATESIATHLERAQAALETLRESRARDRLEAATLVPITDDPRR